MSCYAIVYLYYICGSHTHPEKQHVAAQSRKCQSSERFNRVMMVQLNEVSAGVPKSRQLCCYEDNNHSIVRRSYIKAYQIENKKTPILH
jgi:hypothetical protein